MNKILIVCNQEADFLGPHAVLFRITAAEVGKCIEAPEWIRNTLLFKVLKKEEKIRICTNKIQEELAEPEEPKEAKAPRKRTTKKKDDAE